MRGSQPQPQVGPSTYAHGHPFCLSLLQSLWSVFHAGQGGALDEWTDMAWLQASRGFPWKRGGTASRPLSYSHARASEGALNTEVWCKSGPMTPLTSHAQSAPSRAMPWSVCLLIDCCHLLAAVVCSPARCCMPPPRRIADLPCCERSLAACWLPPQLAATGRWARGHFHRGPSATAT